MEKISHILKNFYNIAGLIKEYFAVDILMFTYFWKLLMESKYQI